MKNDKIIRQTLSQVLNHSSDLEEVLFIGSGVYILTSDRVYHKIFPQNGFIIFKRRFSPGKKFRKIVGYKKIGGTSVFKIEEHLNKKNFYVVVKSQKISKDYILKEILV